MFFGSALQTVGMAITSAQDVSESLNTYVGKE
jgi:hypothetical protein